MQYIIVDKNGNQINGTKVYNDYDKANNGMILLKQKYSISCEIKTIDDGIIPIEEEKPKAKSIDLPKIETPSDQPKPKQKRQVKPNEKTRRIDFMIDKNLYNALQEKANAEYTTMTRVIVQSIIKYLED